MTLFAREIHHVGRIPQVRLRQSKFHPAVFQVLRYAAQILFCGSILAVASRVVTAVLHVTEHADDAQFQPY
jgi:hypothetical protein